MKTKKQFSGIRARLYSSTFNYFTKYVNLPCWLFERYTDDIELLNATIDYINNVTCNIVHINEKFELYTK